MKMADRLVELRKRAEMAVQDMPDSELKIRAFEIAFTHLLAADSADRPGPLQQQARPVPPRKPGGGASTPSSVADRIVSLREQGFFREQRTIKEIRDGLRVHGWHYPLTTLSGRLQSLVQRRLLRREQTSDGKKQIWKYSNP
jgi:hypothetical protein